MSFCSKAEIESKGRFYFTHLGLAQTPDIMPIKNAAQATESDKGEKRGIDWAIVAFFALAYLIAWIFIPVLNTIAEQSGIPDTDSLIRMAEALQFGDAELVVPGWVVYLITRIQDFAFTISGIIMTAYVAGRAGLRELGSKLVRWRVPLRWYLFALLPVALYALAVLVSTLGDPAMLDSFTFESGTLGTILFSAQAGIILAFFTRGALGEEPGLRGFALPRLQESHSPFRASVIIGIFWAGWHLPVLLGRDPVSIVAFLILAFLLSFIFAWLFNNSMQSLIPVMIFHTTQNSEEIFEVLFPGLVGTDWELISTLGLFIVGLIIGVLLWRQARGQKIAAAAG